MKKVLSVLMAAAMVMGMSVTAMADQVWGKGPQDEQNDVDVRDLYFSDFMNVKYNDGNWVEVKANQEDEDKFIFHPEDVAYFEIITPSDALKCGKVEHEHVATCYEYECVLPAHEGAHPEKAFNDDCKFEVKCRLCTKEEHKHTEECEAKWESYTNSIDADWAIYLNDKSSFIKSAEFAVLNPNGSVTDEVSVKYIKVTFQADYDVLDADDCDFYMYIADTAASKKANHENKYQSEKIAVHYLFDNWAVKYVDFDFVNDVDTEAKWLTRSGKAGKGTAAFSFNEEIYYVVKMNPEEEVIFNFSNAYDKDLDKAYGYDADIESYNFKGTKDNFNRVGDVVIPADDDSFVYEVVDGKVVEVEAEYVEDYEVLKGTKVDGWVIETNELGYYIVSDIELEIEAEEVETEVEAEKANPETGAADFVGAAVAMAVVSVAAAGALALKK